MALQKRTLTEAQARKVDPELRRHLEEARDDEIVQAIVEIQGPATLSKEIDPRNFPTREAYRKALIKRRKADLQSSQGPVIKSLKRLSLRVQGGRIMRVVIIAGQPRQIIQALDLPEILHAHANRELQLER